MDPVFAVILCNCTIAIGCLVMSVLLVRLRRQLVALTQWCDLQTSNCSRLLPDAPKSLAASRVQIRQLRQVYRQQSVTVDRLRQIGYSVGILRSLLKRSTFKVD